MKQFDPDPNPFFGEGFISAQFRPTKKTDMEIGFQYVRYNKFVYQQDGAHQC